MESTIINNTQEFKEYPCLGKYRTSDPNQTFVVLFSQPKIGMVVYTGDIKLWKVGYYSEKWQMSCFDKCIDEIKLKN